MALGTLYKHIFALKKCIHKNTKYKMIPKNIIFVLSWQENELWNHQIIPKKKDDFWLKFGIKTLIHLHGN